MGLRGIGPTKSWKGNCPYKYHNTGLVTRSVCTLHSPPIPPVIRERPPSTCFVGETARGAARGGAWQRCPGAFGFPSYNTTLRLLIDTTAAKNEENIFPLGLLRVNHSHT